MKLSVNWLKQFVVDLDNDETEKIVNKLSLSLTEVEDYYDIGNGLSDIVAGEITEIIEHPKIDKLKIAIVKISPNKTNEIVCGADNIKVGNIVPVCLPGGTVIDAKDKEGKKTIKITEREVGGKNSEGMLCSPKELGIGDDHSGIFILPNDTPIGTNISAILKDTIIEIENKGITNRPDCFSHVGIAREIAVQNKFKFKQSPLPQKPIQTTEKPLKVKVEDKESTKRYSALVISDIKVKESPLWMQARLLANGVRPVNNIVDITNYIMLEIGQPSHAFDYDKIAENTLILREAEEGEKIKTLDGKLRKLEKGMLVNADGNKAIGIAGVMGGENTEISNSTTTIILQVENFEMYNIRGTSRKLGLRTEASTRFEKGLDPKLVEECLYRTSEMILDLAGGEIASEVVDVYDSPEEEVRIDLNLSLIETFLGVTIERKEIIEILTRLGIKIDPETEDKQTLNLIIPSFRRDLRIVQDVLEEIIRIWGFDKVPFNLPDRTLSPIKTNKRFELEKKIIREMYSTGSSEVYSYAFIGKELYEKAGIDVKDNLKIKNPLSPELEYMRDTIIPSLLDKASINLQRFENIDIFEISKTALKQKDKQGMHIQPKFVSGLVSNESKLLYREVKGKVEFLFRSLGGFNIEYKNLNGVELFKKANIFHPKKTAILYSDGEQIGILGFVHPKIADNFEIRKNTVIYEINFDLLAKHTGSDSPYERIYNQPVVQRDLSFWIDEKTEAKKIMDTISNLNVPFLIEFKIVDIYRDPANKEKKSIAVQFKLQSEDKTLTDEEITNSIEIIEKAIDSKLKGEIRDSK